MSDSNSSSGGIGFTGLLTIAFIVLKLCGVIDWSWGWVLSPIWISIAIAVIILCIIGVYNYHENKKIVNRQGELKSKWQQRLDEMRESQMKIEELNQRMK